MIRGSFANATPGQRKTVLILMVAAFFIGVSIGLLFADVARGASVVSIDGQVLDPNANPVVVSVRYTITGGIPGPNNSTCNVTALLFQRSADAVTWELYERLGFPSGLPAGSSGSSLVDLPRGQVWRIRVVPEFPLICGGSGNGAEPSNVLEYDLRDKGPLGLCGGAILAPVPIAGYVLYRRRRR